MTILAFLSEPYTKDGDSYISNKASYNFIASCFDEPVVLVGRLSEAKVESPSVRVSSSLFESVPNYESIVDFCKYTIFKPKFLRKYIKRCNEILDLYPDSKVWVRNPSIGCLIFSLCAIKKNRVIYNHMCANAMSAWDNDKYKGFLRFAAYSFSHLFNQLVIRVVSNKSVINLCTGSELLDFCRRYNEQSFQLIDSNIRKVSDISTPYTEGCFRFLFIGRVQDDKGINELLESFILLDANNYELDILGDGALLSSLIDDYKGFTNIKFHGQISNANINTFLSDSDAVIVPSKNKYEGFPRVILEAWSYHLPVIVSDVGGVRAFVEDGINGYLFSHKDSSTLLDKMKLISTPGSYKSIYVNCKKMSVITTEKYWVDTFRRIDKK